jgi:putative Holliday junction resolvase
MGRILAIDYGQKRVGLAVTDEMQIIATGLDTVHVNDLFAYLEKYIESKSIEKIVVGEPRNLDNTPSNMLLSFLIKGNYVAQSQAIRVGKLMIG